MLLDLLAMLGQGGGQGLKEGAYEATFNYFKSILKHFLEISNRYSRKLSQ